MNYDKQNKKLLKLKDRISILEDEIEILKNLKHEVAKFNDLILNHSQELVELFHKEKESRAYELSNTIQNISSILSSRIIYSELELNPKGLEKQHKYLAIIYQKFDKARYIFNKKSREKSNKVEFHGKTKYAISAMSAFDCVPFILIDNALKYTPKDMPIDVRFQTYDNPTIATKLEVIIESIGPKISAEEIIYLKEKKYRAKNALNFPGEGLGLYIADQLCKLHSVELKLFSDKEIITTINNVEYSKFSVMLVFRT